ncbi:MAG: hypothetical protein ACKO11_04240 [Cuspidothrix sp.]
MKIKILLYYHNVGDRFYYVVVLRAIPLVSFANAFPMLWVVSAIPLVSFANAFLMLWVVSAIPLVSFANAFPVLWVVRAIAFPLLGCRCDRFSGV